MAPGTPATARRTSYFAQPGSAFKSPSVRTAGPRRESSVLFPSSEYGPSSSFESFPDAAVGDTVEVPGGWHGTVLYVGPVEGREGTFLGIDLIDLDADKGRNNGSYKGVRYFQAKSGTSGLFAPQGRCRIIENNTKKDRHSDAQLGSRQLNIRPVSRVRSVSGTSAAGSPPHSRKVSADYADASDAAAQQRLLNDNARLTQDLEHLKVRFSEVQKAKAIQAQEMDELMTSVSELENFISTQNGSSNSELDQLRSHIADQEARVEELRREAEERRVEFRQVTEHQQATIEELKSFHELQIMEFEGKHADLEERLASSGTNGVPAGIEADEMERQIAEMTEMFDVLTEEQARARLDIDIANDRIQELEKENDRLLDELADSRAIVAQKSINGPRSPYTTHSRRVSGVENLPDSHPQKRQTIGFLETEVQRLQKENELLRSEGANDPKDTQLSQDEILELQSEIRTLKEQHQLAKDAEIQNLTNSLETEREARRRIEAQHAQMEETLEQTILKMGPDRAASPNATHIPTKPKTLKEPSVRSPRINTQIERDEPGSDLLSEGILKCEYCGDVGHDIINCSNVFGSSGTPEARRNGLVSSASYVDDDEQF